MSKMMLGIAACVLIGAVYLRYRIIVDCGLFGFLKGSEWLWLLGKCQ